jgi:hypothetical protein
MAGAGRPPKGVNGRATSIHVYEDTWTKVAALKKKYGISSRGVSELFRVVIDELYEREYRAEMAQNGLSTEERKVEMAQTLVSTPRFKEFFKSYMAREKEARLENESDAKYCENLLMLIKSTRRRNDIFGSMTDDEVLQFAERQKEIALDGKYRPRIR